MAKAAELMKTVPTLVVPAAYVGVLSTASGLVIRTYDEEGGTVADVGGPHLIGAFDAGVHGLFIRGETENSIAGCAIMFTQGTTPTVYVIDLDDPETVVTVATTHRLAVGGGEVLAASVGVGGGFWWECGEVENVVPDDTQELAYLRRISRDGATITAIVASHNLFNDPGTDRSAKRPFQIDEDTWAVPTAEDVGEGNPEIDTINQAGATGTISGVAWAGDVIAALPLGTTAGSPLNRVVLSGSDYVVEDLFAIPSFTVARCGTRRDANSLIVLVDEGSTGTHQASRLCTYAGSHPITTSTAGPAFERDDDTEALIWIFGL